MLLVVNEAEGADELNDEDGMVLHDARHRNAKQRICLEHMFMSGASMSLLAHNDQAVRRKRSAA